MTSSTNFSFNISSAFPSPSIKPNSFALEPDQNSPVKVLFFSVSKSFEPLLDLTTLIKSECNSNCIFFNLSISSFFSYYLYFFF